MRMCTQVQNLILLKYQMLNPYNLLKYKYTHSYAYIYILLDRMYKLMIFN